MQEGPDPGVVTSTDVILSEVEGSGSSKVTKTQQSSKAILIAFCFCFVVFVLDRLTKWLFMNEVFCAGDVIPCLLAFTKHHNFGLLGDTSVPIILMYGLNALAFAVLVYAMVGHAGKRETGKLFALAVVLGGAIGNLYDRAFYGYVFDWLMFFNLSIINLADVWITIGLAAYAWMVFRNEKHVTKEGVV